MATGKIVWFNEFKGFGFIEDEKGQKYLAHASDLKNKSSEVIKEGQKVKFTPKENAESQVHAEINGLASKIEII